jgi:ankyrin repeat protein
MDRPAPISAEIVQAMVLECHRNLEAVQKLVAQTPALVNACWDWGGGDFETAIGAAAHTGQREIAEFLLANGARLDLFVAAMLGKLGILQAAVTDNPDIIHVRGAHGIPLLNHAMIGGQEEIVKWLKEQGA